MSTPLRYSPPTVILTSSFWSTLFEHKLNVLRLSESTIPGAGTWMKDGAGVMVTGIKKEGEDQGGEANVNDVNVTLKVMNTWESFKSIPKPPLLEGAYKDGSELFLLIFLDQKKNKAVYWQGFPAWQNQKEVDEIVSFDSMPSVTAEVGKGWSLGAIEDGIIRDVEEGGKHEIFAFRSMAQGGDEGRGERWELRRAIHEVRSKELWKGSEVKFVEVVEGTEGHRVVAVDSKRWNCDYTPAVMGWGYNPKLQLAPTKVDLSSQLDHAELEREAANLNLRLMRWRAAPGLDIEGLGEVKCLLLGAGTLGCYVSRALLGWGVRNITFIDSGRVAASNPARQSLYDMKDGREGGWKAEVAKRKLGEIVGDVKAEGHRACIPMPGHVMGPKEVSDCALVEDLIKSHDVLFLLTDSRESRWMPTVVGRREGKTVINIALGFGSWLVCNHGKAENNRGCYFCTDVVAPSNSDKDRTLDQQCTVTRPGLAGIAAGMGVEVMVAEMFGGGGAMGSPPHTVRGDLGGWSLRCFECDRVPYCTACGDKVCEEWGKGGMEFMERVAKDGTGEMLERISGLEDVKKAVDEGGWDGEESEDEDGW